MTADERRAVRKYEAAIQRAAWAPKGKRIERQAELYALVAEMLEREVKPA